MREILFRGKTIYGEWEYGVPVFSGLNNELAFMKQMHSYDRQVIPETVGQFTGLTDKNGKRIFEGDRCRVSRPCVVAYGRITFQNGCFWFVDDGPGGMLRLCDAKMNGFEIEVIGNIHDNTEH